jgi:riboflavin synthase alpha subunit
MFTGIITGVGRIAAVHDLGSSLDHGKRLTIEAPGGYLDDVALGDSIALNGACMTVTTLVPEQHRFTIDISAESLDKTAGLARPGPVNLEKALRASDRLGGHIVSGHVDGVGRVTRFEQVGESCLTPAPARLSPVEKTSWPRCAPGAWSSWSMKKTARTKATWCWPPTTSRPRPSTSWRALAAA